MFQTLAGVTDGVSNTYFSIMFRVSTPHLDENTALRWPFSWPYAAQLDNASRQSLSSDLYTTAEVCYTFQCGFYSTG